MLETLSSSLELKRVKGVIRLYCRALSGAPVEILDTNELVRKNIGWVDEDMASTDGTKVFLPPVVDQYTSKQDNFDWFKVVSTHQVAHLEFGSFEYDFEKPATQFTDRRFDMEKEAAERRAVREGELVGERARLAEEAAEETADESGRLPEFVTGSEDEAGDIAPITAHSPAPAADPSEGPGPGRAFYGHRKVFPPVRQSPAGVRYIHGVGRLPVGLPAGGGVSRHHKGFGQGAARIAGRPPQDTGPWGFKRRWSSCWST